MEIIDFSQPLRRLDPLAPAGARARTQRDLALAVNVGERFIVDLESGKPTCQLGKALAVAKGVGIRLDQHCSSLVRR